MSLGNLDSYATSFGEAAETYERHRPGYPTEAVDWFVPSDARILLDLAAGTGKLTRLLVRPGVDVVAVEPAVEMRAQLVHNVPGVAAVLAGHAERIPLPDASVDAVSVAQAWHWFGPGAMVEISRVLRVGGAVGEFFNCFDDRVDWVATLRGLIETFIADLPPTNWYTDHADDHPIPALGAAYDAPTRREFPYRQQVDPAGLLGLVSSFSFVIRLADSPRRRLLSHVTDLATDHPELAGQERIDIPYRTLVWRAVRNG